MMTVRTRFAPSPTGYLHIGGARTALFCWLYTKHNKGQFILRIEDTDLKRSTDESVQAILQGMEWLELDYDEGPIYQTDRIDRYHEVIDSLLEQGHAYYCYCTPEEVNQMREEAMEKKQKPRYNGYWRDRNDPPPQGIEPAVRFKNPLEGSVVFEDLVHGRIEVKNSELDDLVIMRPDGTPTYNLTVVVDDHDMQITDVIRGDDHINNTPRQINILKAMGVNVPHYGHLPMILGDDGKRLSKRHGAVGVMQFKEDGYLPKAVLNYLVRLGWSHGDREIFTLQEMIKLFDLNACNRSASTFNTEKLQWLNQQYMLEADADELGEMLSYYLQILDIDSARGPDTALVAQLQKERCKTLKEMAENSSYFYQEFEEYDVKAAKKQLRPAALEPMIEVLLQLQTIDDWNAHSVKAAIDATLAKLDLAYGKVGLPLRVATTGVGSSPALELTLAVLGKDTTIKRIQRALDFINDRVSKA